MEKKLSMWLRILNLIEKIQVAFQVVEIESIT